VFSGSVWLPLDPTGERGPRRSAGPGIRPHGDTRLDRPGRIRAKGPAPGGGRRARRRTVSCGAEWRPLC